MVHYSSKTHEIVAQPIIQVCKNKGKMRAACKKVGQSGWYMLEF